MTTTDECVHGTPTNVDCPPCDRAAGIGRPTRPDRTAPRTHVARHHSDCGRCRAAIFPGDQIVRDPDDTTWLCHFCGQEAHRG